MDQVVLMQGNEACVEGAIAAGMRLFAGYPITPSTEIAELSAYRLPQVGGKFIQMEDEIASIELPSAFWTSRSSSRKNFSYFRWSSLKRGGIFRSVHFFQA